MDWVNHDQSEWFSRGTTPQNYDIVSCQLMKRHLRAESYFVWQYFEQKEHLD